MIDKIKSILRNKIPAVVCLGLLQLFSVCLAEPWTPPWDKFYEGPNVFSPRVVPTAQPYVFTCYQSAYFPEEALAKGFGKTVDLLEVGQVHAEEYRVVYRADLDLNALLSGIDINDVDERLFQYALYKAMWLHFSIGDYIKNGQYYRFQLVGTDTIKTERLEAGVFVKNERTVTSLAGGYVSEIAEVHRPYDLIGEATKIYEEVKFFYDYFMSGEDLPYSATLFDYDPFYYDLPARFPGEFGKATYHIKDNPQMGGALSLFIPAEDLDFEHHALRRFLLEAELKSVEYLPGQFVYKVPGYNNGLWWTDEGKYIFFSAKDPSIVKDMLRKYPSVLKESSRVEKDEWRKDEISYIVKKLTELAYDDVSEEQRGGYHDLYAYLNRIAGTVDGAPIFPFTDELTPHELRYHASLVSAWWNSGKTEVKFRDRLLSHNAALQNQDFRGLSRKEMTDRYDSFRSAATEWKNPNSN